MVLGMNRVIGVGVALVRVIVAVMAVIVVVNIVVIVRMLVSLRRLVRVHRDRILPAHAEFGGADAGPRHGLRPDCIRGNGQAAEGATDICERNAGVDQRAKHHVAGRSGKAVEVEDPQNQLILSAISLRQLPGFHERVVALVRQNEVIKHVNADDLAGVHQSHSERRVVCAWSRIA
jgi:hypothetical protein